MLKTIIYIAIGGALGSVLRYLTSLLIGKFWTTNFPLATAITNILGCFIIGFFIGVLEKNNLTNSALKWFLITGFCGGYTTFSAFGFENILLIQNQNSITALLYIACSIFFGLFAVYIGLYLSK